MSNGIFMVERVNDYGYKVRLGTDDTGSESFTSDESAWNKYATADAAKKAADEAGRNSYAVDATPTADPPPASSTEAVRDWYFTFGCGTPYAGRFVKIAGTFASARQAMFDRFGPKWAFQYESADEAGVDRWNLKELV